MKTLIFKTQLLEAKKIQRDVEVPEDFSLYELAGGILKAYEFDFDHAFGFFRKITSGWGGLAESESYELFADLEVEAIEPTNAKSVKKTQVSEVWKNPKDKMMMLFDYGDEWRFIVTLKGFGEKQVRQKYPHLLTKTGEAPEQYPKIEE